MKRIVILIVLLGMVFSGVVSAQDSEMERTYALFVPDSYDDSQAVPLLIVLHGATQTGRGIEQLTDFDKVAEREGFIVVYPNGLGNDWDFGAGVRTLDGWVSVNDPAFIAGLVDELGADYNIDTEQVFVTGFSNGGIMTYVLMCSYPQVFKAGAVVSASFSPFFAERCTPDPISMMIIHGTDDPILSWDEVYANNGRLIGFSITQSFTYWGLHNLCNPDSMNSEILDDLDPEDESTVRRVWYSDCVDDTEVQLYGILGGGHTWAGHRVGGGALGETNMDFDASETIWAWFAGLE